MAKIHVKLPPHLSPSGRWGEVYGYVTSLSHFQVEAWELREQKGRTQH